MTINVLSWKSALALGHNPTLYSYLYEDVPIGEYLAVLDFKIWAKKVMAINCYFTQVTTGKKFQLTAYCNDQGVYKVGDVNFSMCPIKRTYSIVVNANQKKKIICTNAVLVS